MQSILIYHHYPYSVQTPTSYGSYVCITPPRMVLMCVTPCKTPPRMVLMCVTPCKTPPRMVPMCV